MNSRITVGKIFTFDSAHHLDNYNGKCANIHGHTYELEVAISGYPSGSGIVMDFGILKSTVNSEIIDKLDHKNLNEVFDGEHGFGQFNPTAEMMVLEIYSVLYKKFAILGYRLEKVKLWEKIGSSYAELINTDRY